MSLIGVDNSEAVTKVVQRESCVFVSGSIILREIPIL